MERVSRARRRHDDVAALDVPREVGRSAAEVAVRADGAGVLVRLVARVALRSDLLRIGRPDEDDDAARERLGPRLAGWASRTERRDAPGWPH